MFQLILLISSLVVGGIQASAQMRHTGSFTGPVAPRTCGTISFTLKEQVSPAQQQKLFERLRATEGVVNVGMLLKHKATSRLPADNVVYRMGNIIVTPDTPCRELIDELSLFPEFENLSIPPKRVPMPSIGGSNH